MPLSPDCRDGKCTACVGQAFDENADRVVVCTCPHHTESGRAVVTG